MHSCGFLPPTYSVWVTIIGTYYHGDPYNFCNSYLSSLVKWVTQKVITEDISKVQAQYNWPTATMPEIGWDFCLPSSSPQVLIKN